MPNFEKHMLHISIEKNDERSFFKFESEPYYKQEKFIPYFEKLVDSFDLEHLENNVDFLESIGLWILLGFQYEAEKVMYQHISDITSLTLYPMINGHQKKIRMDSVPYLPKKRTFCTKLALFENDFDKALDNDEYLFKLALTVLNYLPLPQEDDADSYV